MSPAKRGFYVLAAGIPYLFFLTALGEEFPTPHLGIV